MASTRQKPRPPLPDDSAEVELIIQFLRQWWEPAGPVDIRPVNWSRFSHLARSAKVFGLLRLDEQHGFDAPADIMAEYFSWRRISLIKNLENARRSVEVLAILENEHICTILFKGPIRTFKVYKNWDCRPSSDVDVLVDPEHYQNARKILPAHGFSSVVESDSAWWHRHLGETAFLGPNDTGPTVDLHHKVQQPGTPTPKNFPAFFASSQVASFAGRRIRTLSSEGDLVLCIINFAKALRSHTPWIVYAHELIQCLRGMSAGEEEDLAKFCASMGLTRMYLHTRRLSEDLFSNVQITSGDQSALIDLRMSSFGKGRRRRFFRTGLLWQWTDGPILKRLANFSLEISKSALSEMAFHSTVSVQRKTMHHDGREIS